MKNLKQILTIAGLLLLVSCGQPISKTELETEDGDEIELIDIANENEEQNEQIDENTQRLQNIQECLLGERPSCKRAYKEGFTAFPLLMEDLKKVTIVRAYGQDLTRFKTGTDFVEWKTTIPLTVASTFKYRVKLYVRLYDDAGAQIAVFYNVKYSSTGSWSSDKTLVLDPSSSTSWRNQVEPWLNLVGNPEWSSDNFNSLEIDESLVEVIARESEEE